MGGGAGAAMNVAPVAISNTRALSPFARQLHDDIKIYLTECPTVKTEETLPLQMADKIPHLALEEIFHLKAQANLISAAEFAKISAKVEEIFMGTKILPCDLYKVQIHSQNFYFYEAGYREIFAGRSSSVIGAITKLVGFALFGQVEEMKADKEEIDKLTDSISILLSRTNLLHRYLKKAATLLDSSISLGHTTVSALVHVYAGLRDTIDVVAFQIRKGIKPVLPPIPV